MLKFVFYSLIGCPRDGVWSGRCDRIACITGRKTTQEAMPNKSAIVTLPAANGKPLAVIALEKGSATPPAERFKAAGEPDRVASRTCSNTPFSAAATAAATKSGFSNQQLTTKEQLELQKAITYVIRLTGDPVTVLLVAPDIL